MKSANIEQPSIIQQLQQPVTSLQAYRSSIRKVRALLSQFLTSFHTSLNFYASKENLQEIEIQPFHSTGFLQKALTPCRHIPEHMLSNWMNDTEHGFVHGLSVCFWAVLAHTKGKITYNAEVEELFSAGLLHDFLRSSDIHEKHDSLLQDWYPNLPPSTYSHSDPSKKDAFNPLVIGDRIELLRFSDCAEWVDEGIIEACITDENMRNMILVYYRFIRPALAKIFESKDDVWLRHSVERDLLLDGTINNDASLFNFPSNNENIEKGTIEEGKAGMFPEKFWAPSPGYWCIEIGNTPFGMNILRAQKFFRPITILPMQRYLDLNGQPIRPIRDHFAAKADIPINEWIALLQQGDLIKAENEQFLLSCGGVIYVKNANAIITFSNYIGSMMRALVIR